MGILFLTATAALAANLVEASSPQVGGDFGVPSADRCLLAMEEAHERGFDFGDFGGLQCVYLYKGQRARESFTLKKGTEYLFVAVGGKAHSDIELALRMPTGVLAARETKVGRVSELTYICQSDGSFVAEISSLEAEGTTDVDVTLICLERVSYVNKTPVQASLWMNQEKKIMLTALSRAGARVPSLSVSPESELITTIFGSARVEIPWFLLIGKIRGDAKKASVTWMGQRYGSKTQMVLASEFGAKIVAASVNEKGTAVASGANSDSYTLKLSDGASVDGTVRIAVENQSKRDLYIAIYVIQAK